mmetsp:Transcript_87580/g.252566  ORF Transcript_87580/g.252566 Transcript_87580/m.252566 type:complete len:195 (+) Transcript_87580:105-689(+)
MLPEMERTKFRVTFAKGIGASDEERDVQQPYQPNRVQCDPRPSTAEAAIIIDVDHWVRVVASRQATGPVDQRLLDDLGDENDDSDESDGDREGTVEPSAEQWNIVDGGGAPSSDPPLDAETVDSISLRGSSGDSGGSEWWTPAQVPTRFRLPVQLYASAAVHKDDLRSFPCDTESWVCYLLSEVLCAPMCCPGE